MTAIHNERIVSFDGDPTEQVFERIHGAEIESMLLNLASIGGARIDGIPEQPERYSVCRLALSPIDIEARKTFVAPLMEKAGMTLQEHPFGLIGTYKGEDPDLPPLVIFSHTDSVPEADMYDGVTGVIGGIKAVEAIIKSGINPKRNIHVIALTGEESSAFGFALFGSRGMWHGLTEAELDAHIPEGKTIRETLGAEASEIVKQPVVGEGGIVPTPHAVIELHVEQNGTLDKAGIDLGVVEKIAAPKRFKVKFGEESLEIDQNEPANSAIIKITVRGKNDHSGATPMGPQNRADGLVEIASLLLDILAEDDDLSSVDIGSLDVEKQSINVIPGVTTSEIRVSGKSEHDLEARMNAINEILVLHNLEIGNTSLRFDKDPISATLNADDETRAHYFKKVEVQARQKAALEMIVKVNEVANSNSHANVVGTVGRVDVDSNGIIILGLDIRGIDKDSRDAVIETIKTSALKGAHKDGAQFGSEEPGSGDPVTLDPELVKLAKETIERFSIGSSKIMFSAAGHDSQNAAKAGHSTVMIFCQSNAGGVAHNPAAYTNPENLEKGVKALAALILELV